MATNTNDPNISLHRLSNEKKVDDANSLLHYSNIYEAVRKMDVNAVNMFIKQGVDINAADIHGNGPLHYAIINKDPTLVESLIDAAANVNASCPNGFQLLYHAIKTESVEICEQLIKAGALTNAVGYDGNSMLYYGIDANNFELVKLLISPPKTEPITLAADVNYIGYGGFSILFHAINKGNEEIVRHLIEAKVDVNKHSDGRSPLYQAVMLGQVNIVTLLLQHKAKLSADEIKTIREKDIRTTNQECIDLLLESMAIDPSTLIQAIENQNVDLIELLINGKMKVTAMDEEHHILYKAVNIGNLDVIKLLIENGANVNGYENNSQPKGSVLYLVTIEKEDATITDLLIANGASIYIEYNGYTLLHHSIEKCNKNIIQAMFRSRPTEAETEQRSTINKQTVYYCNPLEWALVCSTPEIVEILIKQGAQITSGKQWCTTYMTYDDFINKISHDNLQIALDNCICKERDSNTLSIEYRTMCNNNGSDESTKEILLTLWKVSEVEKFRDLMPHPLFTSFIQCMWLSLTIYFRVNCFFCIFFYANLIWYQTMYYCNSDALQFFSSHYISYGLLTFLYIICLCREATQFYINSSSYVRNVENYIEFLLLLCILYTLTGLHTIAKIEIIGMCNVLMGLSLTLMIGHLDFAATPIYILRTVSLTFFRYFIPYTLIFLSFARTFYQLFYSGEVGSSQQSTSDDNDANSTSSSSNVLFMEVVRVLAKFTGELEVSDIRTNNYALFPFILTVAFIFLCPIIMLNLLNGLAVFDILNEEHLKIFKQKSRLNYLYNAQMYFKIPRLGEILQFFQLGLQLKNIDKIYIYSDNVELNTMQSDGINCNSNNIELNVPIQADTENRNSNDIESNTLLPSRISRDNAIFNGKILKDAKNITLKLDSSRFRNLPNTILSEVLILNKFAGQMNERFNKLDNELEEIKSKFNTIIDDLLQKIQSLNAALATK